MSLADLSKYYLTKAGNEADPFGIQAAGTPEDFMTPEEINDPGYYGPDKINKAISGEVDGFVNDLYKDVDTKKDEQPAMNSGMWDQVSEFIKNNPGMSIGGLAGLGLGGMSLGGGGLGVGLLGAAAPVAGYLYDQYKRTGQLPFSSPAAAATDVAASPLGTASGAAAGS